MENGNGECSSRACLGVQAFGLGENSAEYALERHWHRHLVATSRALQRRPSRRNSEDKRSIYVLLQSIPLLYETLSPGLLLELTSIIHLQCFPNANTVVFQQGDEVINFYIVLEGTLLETRRFGTNTQLLSVDNSAQWQQRHRVMEGEVFGFENPLYVTLRVGGEDKRQMMSTSHSFQPRGLCPPPQPPMKTFSHDHSSSSSSRVSVSPSLPRHVSPTVVSTASAATSQPFPQQHLSSCIRQSSIVTEGKCHVLYANWWHFCHLIVLHCARSPSEVNSSAQATSLNPTVVAHDTLQFLFRAFSHRRQENFLGQCNTATTPQKSPLFRREEGNFVSPATYTYREVMSHRRHQQRVSHVEKFDRYSPQPPPSISPPTTAQYSPLPPRRQSPSPPPPQFECPEEDKSPRRRRRRRRNCDPPSSSPPPQVLQMHRSSSPHNHEPKPASPVTPKQPPQSSNLTPDDAKPSIGSDSTASPQNTSETVERLASALLVNNRPSNNSIKSNTTGSFYKPSKQQDNAGAEMDKATIWKMAITIGEGLICDYFDEFLSCKKLGKPLFWSGAALISWLCDVIHSQDRLVMKGIWQAFLEEGILVPKPPTEQQVVNEVLDRKQFEYCFSPEIIRQFKMSAREEEVLTSAITSVLKLGVDAAFRNILQKPPSKRLPEELTFVYNEMVNHKALSSLSNMVKRQLVSVVELDIHLNKVGEVVFRQGDVGDSWYIILKGSVDVHMVGKGVVCTLYEGDDFGNLALINRAPRAATIFIKAPVCHFLKVYKNDFDRILLDVEANTVRLKEHGRDVLVLTKSEKQNSNGTTTAPHAYSIIAGTVEKIVENILESRIHPDTDIEEILTKKESREPTLRDFLYCYPSFTTTQQLVECLDACVRDELKRVRSAVVFLWRWFHLMKTVFLEEPCLNAMVEKWLSKDAFPFDSNSSTESSTVLMRSDKEYAILGQLLELSRTQQQNHEQVQHSNSVTSTTVTSNNSAQSTKNKSDTRMNCKYIAQTDLVPVPIYYTDKFFHQLWMPANTSAKAVLEASLVERGASKSKLNLSIACLCEVKSTGEVVPFQNEDIGVTFRIAHTSRLFVANAAAVKEVLPTPQQQLPAIDSNANFLELVNAEEFATVFCHFDWQQFCSVTPHELLYLTMGRGSCDKITPNLDRLLQRFHRVQVWVVSEVLCAPNIHQRSAILRKFIKLAHTLLQMKNLNTFVAIVMALNSPQISRLRSLWDKIPGKQMRLFRKFATLMDTTHNSCMFRQKFQSFRPPFIPFVELLLNELACIHGGNQTRHVSTGLVNFEKVQLLSKIVTYFDDARGNCSGPFLAPTKRDKTYEDIWSFINSLTCVEDPRRLNSLSLKVDSSKK